VPTARTCGRPNTLIARNASEQRALFAASVALIALPLLSARISSPAHSPGRRAK
jgi:hypothetical protein